MTLLGYPLSDWYSFFWALDLLLAVFVAVSAIVIFDEKPINKNRFTR